MILLNLASLAKVYHGIGRDEKKGKGLGDTGGLLWSRVIKRMTQKTKKGRSGPKDGRMRYFVATRDHDYDVGGLRVPSFTIT